MNHKKGKRISPKRKRKLTVLESLRETVSDLGRVIDTKETLKEFDKMLYKEPKKYSKRDIIKLRTEKMKMSQAVFAAVCNAKLSTVQKWERGVALPTPPVYRLFQLIESRALELIAR
jgi:DNA-binding transcriptional regulator YiaG